MAKSTGKPGTPLASRRRFMAGLAGLVAAPAIITPAHARPWMLDGITAGDVTADSAVIWARADRSSRMIVKWSTTDRFLDVNRIAGQLVTGRTGYIGQIPLTRLPPGQEIFYRVQFETPDGLAISPPRTGHVRTPGGGRDVTFVFGGDQCGAGWGINPEWGGLRMFETMRATNPDFLIHLGDRIYADAPMQEVVILEDGSRWRNIVTPAKEKVAETLAEFRGNYSYNFLDEHYRRFSAEVPMMATWDDHEVTNDWWPGRRMSWKKMSRKGYVIKEIDQLARHGRQAFFEYTPMRREAVAQDRIYRKISHGPLIDVFMLDGRSYRSPGNRNRQQEMARDTALLGTEQLEWLKRALAESTALWKIIGNPLPLAHVRKAERPRYDKWANQDHGAPLGRELEIADILSHIRRHAIRNVVWLAADVHYAAAHHFQPDRAAFTDFDPFWEFVAGPFHTRPGRIRYMDKTFGPERLYRSPLSPRATVAPADGYLYFGHARIDAKSGVLTVSLRDLKGQTLYATSLEPVGGWSLHQPR